MPKFRFNEHGPEFIPGTRDSKTAEKKQKILKILGEWAAEQQKTNPDFNIDTNNLKAFIKTSKDMKALGITGTTSIMYYFSYDTNFLNEKLGLPQTNKKRNF